MEQTKRKGKSGARVKGSRSKAEQKIKDFKRLDPKFIRDPIHDLIRIDSNLILDLLDTAPMQRLKRIKQLGLASFVYPGADHSRFSHSLGAYHLATRMLSQLKVTDEYDRAVVQVAALLHDAGHGPFSHLFEKALKAIDYKRTIKHEERTKSIITDNAEVKGVLKQVGPDFARDVRAVIGNIYKPRCLSSIVSSQFDVDRLDYMLRDSHMAGVRYGEYDLSWIMRNLMLADARVREPDGDEEQSVKVIAIDARRGLSCLEDYLMGNFYLYTHLYYHKTVIAAESMVAKILERAIKDSGVCDIHPALKAVSEESEIPLDIYLSLDDHTVMSWIRNWAVEDGVDSILQDLCNRLLARKLFKAIPFDARSIRGFRDLCRNLEKVLEAENLDPNYYLIEADPARVAYKNFFFLERNNQADQEIYYLDRKGVARKYTAAGLESERYMISDAILKLKFTEHMFIVAPECEEAVRAKLEEHRR